MQKFYLHKFITSLCLFLSCGTAYSQSPIHPQLDTQLPIVQEFIDKKCDQIIRFNEQWDLTTCKSQVENNLKQAMIQPKIIKKITKPAEKVLKWYQYKKIFFNQRHTHPPELFWTKHSDTIDQISAKSGIPKSILLGILSVESKFGEIKGSYRLIDSLSTLSFFYEKRKDFFQDQLAYLLAMQSKAPFNILEVKGSYAGAFGISQFMPESYVKYAQSFNSQEAPDILHSFDDAIASIANYLVKRGKWSPNQPIAKQWKWDDIDPKTRDLLSQVKREYRTKLVDLQKIGIQLPQNQFKGASGIVIMVDSEDNAETVWVTYPNFDAIMSYNISSKYALTVFLLGEKIIENHEQT